MFKIFQIFIVGLFIGLTMAGCAKSDSSEANTSGDNKEKVILKSIQLSTKSGDTNVSVPVNTSGSLEATAFYSDNTTKDVTKLVTYSSTDKSVVTVEADGSAKAIKSGISNITAKMDSINSNSVSIHVQDIILQSISISPVNESIPNGYTQEYEAMGHYNDGSSYLISKDVTWTSSNVKVATISKIGIVTTKSAGTTTIIASQDNVEGNATLTVTTAILESITLAPTQKSVPKGTKVKYAAIGNFSDGNTLDISKNVTWSSSDINVAKMNANVASTINEGSTTIVAKHAAITSNAANLDVTGAVLTALEIKREVPGASIDSDDKFVVGTSIQTHAIGTYSDGVKRDVTDIVDWTTSTTTVTVTQEGLITAIQPGVADVTVSYNNIDGSELDETVVGEVHEASIIDLSINGDNESVVGINIQLEALALFDNDEVIDVTSKANWKSDNPFINVIAGKVSATKVGDANITASFDNKTVVHQVSFTEATLSHLEIQERYCEGGNCKKITGKTVSIELVDKVSYPTDPDGLSPNAYYPTVWAVYTDGRKEYVNADAIWWSDDQNAAYVNYLKGSFVFGKDINPKVEIKASYKGKNASFFVNVIAQRSKTLDEIVIKNGWNESLPDITEATVVVGEETPLVAYGWFTYANGDRDLEYINTNVSWKSSDLKVAWINDVRSSYVRGISEGKATVSATWQGKTATVKMTVTPDNSPTLSSIFFEKGCGSTQTGELINHETPLLLEVGQEQCINAWGKYSDGTVNRLTTTVVWTADDRSIASMDPLQRNSRVKGESLGSTFVSATQDSVSGDAPVEVVELNKVYIEGTNEAPIGSTQQLNAIVYLSNGKIYNANDSVNWDSNDTSLATIDANGLVTAIAKGSVTFTATGKKDSSITVTHEMKVVDAALVSIQIEKSYNPSIPQPISTLDVEISTEEYITAWGLYTDGTRRYINTDTVWWSSDQQVASINYLASSKVYGKNLGTATITARFGGKEATLAVTVKNSGPQLQSIEIRNGWGQGVIDITDQTFDVEVGAEQAVVAYGHYDDGVVRDINAKVFWTSSDTDVAAIFDMFNSNVYGISLGTATITASWQGVTAKTTANVIASTAPVLDHIEIQRSYVSDGNGEVLSVTNPLVLQVGDVQYVTAWAVFTNGDKEYINTQALWRSDDQSIASMPILQTSSNVTGVAEGSTTINATYEGMTGTAKVVVQSAPGKLVLENIQWDKADTTLSNGGLTANGTSNAHAVWYHQTEGNGFEVGQKLSTISFDFAATGGATAYVNVYVKDPDGTDARLIIGIDDTTNNGYMTWDLAMEAGFKDYTIRRYIESSLEGITQGNFYLRIGDSTYTGSDPFEITKFIVTTP